MSERPGEASNRIAFTGSTLARLSEKRTDDAIDVARADLQTRWFVHLGGKVLLDFVIEERPRSLFSSN